MFAAVVALSLVVAAPEDKKDKEKPLPEAAQKELKKFEGKWKATKLVANGGDAALPDNTDELMFEFKGRRLVYEGMELLEIIAADTTTDPKCIDFKSLMDFAGISKDKVYEGVYKLDGDTLTLALYGGEGAKRPAKLESEKDSGVVLVVLKREKK